MAESKNTVFMYLRNLPIHRSHLPENPIKFLIIRWGFAVKDL